MSEIDEIRGSVLVIAREWPELLRTIGRIDAATSNGAERGREDRERMQRIEEEQAAHGKAIGEARTAIRLVKWLLATTVAVAGVAVAAVALALKALGH